MAKTKESTTRRAQRVRRQIKKVANGRPRLSVHRSSKNIYAQVIDDAAGHTVAAASTIETDL
jgi:large subunit ribosomal protein L18